MEQRVTTTFEDGVADVRLSRPDKLNALDLAMFQAIADAADAVAAEPGARVAVLSGEGRGFCAGLDMGMFSGGADGFGDLADRLPGRITNLAQQVAYGWIELAIPVVAALHGAVLGGGLQIALGADIRFVTPDAKLSVMEIRWGLLPDMTGPQTLVRLVGLDVAKELCFTGRTISGADAVAMGLATHLSDAPYEDAKALAEEIAGKNPEAVQGSKALLNAAGTRPLAEGFLDESVRMRSIIGSPNQVEAVMAQLEKRPATFTDPT